MSDPHAMDNARYPGPFLFERQLGGPSYFYPNQRRIPVMAPGEDIKMMNTSPPCAGFSKPGGRRWAGPGRGWIDPVRERKGRRLVHRRAPKSWSVSFASGVLHRKYLKRFARDFRLQLERTSVMVGSIRDAELDSAIANAFFAALIDMPAPPPPTRWQRFRGAASLRYRSWIVWPIKSALYSLSRWIERLSDRL